MKGLTPAELDERLRAFLSEDLGPGDVTTELTVPAEARARGELVAKSACVVSGLEVARRVFELLDPQLTWESLATAGQWVEPPTVLARLSGQARAILAAERVALNLLQRMCGIATVTRRYVEAVAGTGCKIMDTRKTAPGLRAFDRQAVADGGGVNHRLRLSDMVLIKDNHLRLSSGIPKAVTAARRGTGAGMLVEVEVESEEEMRQAVEARADAVLVDNQSPATLERWVGVARDSGRRPQIEASGGIILERARAYAMAGADRISIGALTHSVTAADVSLELQPEG